MKLAPIDPCLWQKHAEGNPDEFMALEDKTSSCFPDSGRTIISKEKAARFNGMDITLGETKTSVPGERKPCTTIDQSFYLSKIGIVNV